MLFNSFPFILFFVVVSVSYYLLPHRYRWFLLLLASCYFYMAFVPKYILILFFTILVNYYAGILLEKYTKSYERRLVLMGAVCIDIAILGFFKYFNFFVENVNALAQFLHFNYSLTFLSIILPLGLSFHTFQALSYVIEVYRGNQRAERHFGIYSLYVMYYPQLVAGPIERPQNLLHQFHSIKKFDPHTVIYGLKRMAWGFFKKTVVADHLAIIVGVVYANPHAFDGPTLIFATVLFAFQLYCDFSGYSDIAVGSSRVLGITLMENFERPYFAKSIAEFWRRWHISLSSWLRDYVYYPLVRSTKHLTRAKLYTATIVTFLVSGLWHGAAWGYVCMGALFGFYIVGAEITKQWKTKVLTLLKLTSVSPLVRNINMFVTFILVCTGWVFFRAHSIDDAFYIISHSLDGLPHFILNSYSYYTWKNLFSVGGLVQKSDFIIGAVSLIILLCVDLVERKQPIWEYLQRYPTFVRWGFYYSLVIAIVACGRFGAQEFIYFQF